MADNKFYKGYYISKEKYTGFDHNDMWNDVSLHGQYTLYCHKDLPYLVSVSSDSKTKTIILGLVYDPFSNQYNDVAIADELNSYLSTGDEQRFYDKFEQLCGSFLCIFSTDSNIRIWPDTFATKSIYYDKKHFEIASHSQILCSEYHYSLSNEYINVTKDEQYCHRADKSLPGIMTPYAEINRLSCNTYIDLPSCEVHRFFPIRTNTYKYNESTIDEVCDFFVKQVKMLADHNKLAISVTAGNDSRLTLASSKLIRDKVFYYTIPYRYDAKYDASFANTMVTELGGTHHILDFHDDADNAFRKVIQDESDNITDVLSENIAYTLHKEFPKDYLHLKSNGSETCRAYLRQLHPHGLSKKLTIKKAVWFIYGFKDNALFEKIFEDSLTFTNFPKSEIYGYDVYDLLWWEFYDGILQADAQRYYSREQDMVLAFNCRKMINMMLSVPTKEKMGDKFYHTLIEKMWAECMNYPINAHKQKKLTFSKKYIRPIIDYIRCKTM